MAGKGEKMDRQTGRGDTTSWGMILHPSWSSTHRGGCADSLTAGPPTSLAQHSGDFGSCTLTSLTSLPTLVAPFPLDTRTRQDFLRICMQIAGCQHRGGTLFRASPVQLLCFPGAGQAGRNPSGQPHHGAWDTGTASKALHDFRERPQVLPVPQPQSAMSICSVEGYCVGAGKNKIHFYKALG